LSALLLVGAGLFLRSLQQATSVDLGLDARHVRVVAVDFAGTGRPATMVAAFFERALERVRAVPGVTSASLSTSIPLQSASGMTLRTSVRGEWIQTAQGTPMGSEVADQFFAATGMRIVQGRDFTAADRGGPPVVVVNEALARFAWPGRSPVGQCAYLSSAPESCARVVGVAGNARTFRLREEQRQWLYTPLAPSATDRRVLLVRVAPGAESMNAMDGTLRRVLRELDPGAPYVDVRLLGDALDPQLRPWRLGAAVFTAFGLLTALLAALGLYTAVAYAVTQRRREIGVRLAVGAATSSVVRLVLGDSLRVAAAGVAMGLVAALLGGRWIADLLFDTSPREPVVLAVVGLALLAVAMVASLTPARRAARVNPTEALRAD
jgi:predicted permease